MPLLQLPPVPSTVLSLPDEQLDELESRYPGLAVDHDHCVTCRGTGSFRWYAPMTQREQVGEYECPPGNQGYLHLRFLYSGIGLAYQRLSWVDQFSVNVAHLDLAERYTASAAEYIDSGLGLILHGEGRGTGKTMFAELLLKRLVSSGFDGYSTTFASLLSSFSGGWTDKAERAWFVRRVRNAGVLLIDDLGREHKGVRSIADSTLEEVIRHRVQQSMPTILTTNLTPEEIRTGYGGHTMSVLYECSELVEFSGPDRREEVRLRRLKERDLRLVRPVVIE
jgi:DNA replication protein DnaC